MKAVCIIPSRYASTRLPGKPLRMIAGETLVHRVYERALLAKVPEQVIVATDHEDIEKEVKAFGGHVVMTSVNHPTGTDRLAEVAAKFPQYDIIVNVQGDEPLIDPDVIDGLAKDLMDHEDLDMATVATPLRKEEYDDPSAVKVVVNRKMEQTPLEKTESLEQLRALEMGYKIGVISVKTEDIGIDTEADLKKANEYFERNHL